MNQLHRRTVDRIAAQIRNHYLSRRPFRIFHGSTNSTRILEFKRSEMIDVSSLDQVLSINVAKRVVMVEPNVPMDKLIEHTLRYGLVPPVVPEFPGITVGGGIQGGAGESSSFKYGFFSQTVNWAEFILADGRVIKASPTKHPDLFYGSAGSSGTLGVITAAEIQLIPAKKYVQLTYKPVSSFKAALNEMCRQTEAEGDFIDGIMFGADHGVIITGKLTDHKNDKLRRFSRAHDQWYYLHAQKINEAKQTVVETVPLKDYLFRYDRGAFWVGRYAFDRFEVPFNGMMRFLLNPILHTRKLYQALQDSGASQEHIVQDLTLPLGVAQTFLEYLDETEHIYPLWLCPVKPEPRSPLLCNGLDTPLAINIGVWGPQIADYKQFLHVNRRIEAKLSELGGKKWLYAHTYYTEEEFWQIYDKQWYERLRKKYSATTLPSIYEKVRVKDRHVVDARRGVYKTIFGRAKLRIRD